MWWSQVYWALAHAKTFIKWNPLIIWPPRVGYAYSRSKLVWLNTEFNFMKFDNLFVIATVERCSWIWDRQESSGKNEYSTSGGTSQHGVLRGSVGIFALVDMVFLSTLPYILCC